MGYGPVVMAIAAAGWAAGWILLLRGRQRTPAAGRAINPSAVSIIVPARNEQENLPRLLSSIQRQNAKPAEVIVVDDASTDRTSDIAREFGATVISPPPLPDAWRGKTWACHNGAKAASGELLLFMDADTWFEDDGLANLLALFTGGAFSVGPWHVAVKLHEQLSVYFNLVMNCAVVPRGLFGQMLLVEKNSYESVRGHEEVKGRILENLALAAEFRHRNLKVHSTGGRGILSFRMYPENLGQLLDGWIKAFSTGARHTPIGSLLCVVIWLTGMTLAAGLPLKGWIGVAIYLLFAIQLATAFSRVGSFRWYVALLFPIPLFFFFVVFAWSALRPSRSVTWKGRTIHAD